MHRSQRFLSQVVLCRRIAILAWTVPGSIRANPDDEIGLLLPIIAGVVFYWTFPSYEGLPQPPRKASLWVSSFTAW